MVPSELVQQGPGIKAGVVAIVEQQAQRVISDRLDAADADVLFAGLQYSLAAAVACHLGGWGEYPQVFKGQLEMGSVIEAYFEQPRLGAQFDVGGLGHKDTAALGGRRMYRDRS